MSDEGLAIWVVYDHPKEFHHGYLARKWLSKADAAVATEDTICSVDLGSVRARLELKGLTKIARHVSDDPCILETWL